MYTTKEEENNTMTKRQQEKLNSLLTEIAKEELQVETLEKRWSDNLDSVSYTHLTLPTICSV